MKTSCYVKVLLMGMCLTITDAAFSQPKSRYTIAKYDELNRLICNTCGNKLVHYEYTKEQHKHSAKQGKLDCAIYEYPCSKCGTTWLLHILRMMNPLLDPPVNDVVEEKPSGQKKNRGNEIHKAIKDSCYTVSEKNGCKIVKLRDCQKTLYCYLKEKNIYYIVDENVNGGEKRICPTNGEVVDFLATHDVKITKNMTIAK